MVYILKRVVGTTRTKIDLFRHPKFCQKTEFLTLGQIFVSNLKKQIKTKNLFCHRPQQPQQQQELQQQQQPLTRGESFGRSREPNE